MSVFYILTVRISVDNIIKMSSTINKYQNCQKSDFDQGLLNNGIEFEKSAVSSLVLIYVLSDNVVIFSVNIGHIS